MRVTGAWHGARHPHPLIVLQRGVLAARIEHGLHLGVVHVLTGDEVDAGVFLALDLLALPDDIQGGVHALVAHLERVLDHERADETIPEGLDLLGVTVPADDGDLPLLARLPHGLSRAEY